MKKKTIKSPRKSKAPGTKNPQIAKEQETAEQTKFNPKLQKQFSKKSGHPYPDK